MFAEAGMEPNIAYETGSFEMVRGLVANGYGYSLLHSRAPHHRALDGSPLVSIPLSEPMREMHMGLARLASSRPTRMAQAFAQVCRDHLHVLLADQGEA
jgi:DNA-binding transcriptional LysR family regulator